MSETQRLVIAGQCLIKRDVRTDASPGFAEVRRLIGAADHAFTNFEATVNGRRGGAPTKEEYMAAVPASVLDSLKEIGFGMLSLCNNHALDFGVGGVLSTLEEVEERGFTYTGAGRTLEEASRIGLSRSGAGTVALIAMDCGPQRDEVYARDGTDAGPAVPGINPMRFNGEGAALAPNEADRSRVVAAIAKARTLADLVLVYTHSHHWDEVMWRTLPAMRRLAQGWIDAGADLVVGHGTPAFQGIEIYRGRPIFHGLGNFIFHSWRPQSWLDQVGIKPWQGVVATCAWSRERKITAIELRPIAIGHDHVASNELPEQFGDVPILAHGAYGEQIIGNLADLSRAFGTDITVSGTTATIAL